MNNCIKLNFDGSFELLDLDLESWRDICSALNQSGFEIVRTSELRHFFDDNVVMLIGDCSAINGSHWNPYASEFYSGPGIFGDVIFCCEDGPELSKLRDIETIVSRFVCDLDFEFLEG